MTLKQGDRIAVVAPAGLPSMPDLEAGIALLRRWGYEVVTGPNLHAQHRYTAGPPEVRAADLTWALTAPEIRAVYIARGGYGHVHCLPRIPWDEVAPRPVIGFSDVTALLLALRERTQAIAIHAPTLDKLATKTEPATQEAVRRMLALGDAVEIRGERVRGGDGDAEGTVLGGNLCVLASLCGTPWQLRAEEALLVLEDVDEAPYRLDRMVTQLVESGCLRGVRAILLGEFLRCVAPKGAAWTVKELLVDLFAPLGVPIVTGVAVGHGPANLPWYVGGHGHLAGGVLRVRPRAGRAAC